MCLTHLQIMLIAEFNLVLVSKDYKVLVMTIFFKKASFSKSNSVCYLVQPKYIPNQL